MAMKACGPAYWCLGVGLALALCACAGGGDDKDKKDTGTGLGEDAGQDAALVPDSMAPPEEVAELVEEVRGPDLAADAGEPCVPDCTGKVCGEDDGCGKPCVVNESCTSYPPCAEGFCDKSGVCAFNFTQAECDDGNVCTVGDTCKQGKCTAGTDVLDCDDENPCTSDGCDPADGCVSQNTTAACEDGDPCTKGDTCKEGACESGAADLCDDKNLCTDDWCKPAEGCQHDPADGLACDDNNKCTQFDQCLAGKCQSGAPVSCDDKNPCTVDPCDPAVGCANANAQNGTPCVDPDPCTTADFCLDGMCKPSGDKDCDDFNNCTDDSCGPGGQCVHEKLTGDIYCSDNDPCTEPDFCVEGECQPGPLMPGCG
jgi:hypothetical protein